jgi:hypothetical protein
MGSLLVGLFALIGLAGVLASAAAFWLCTITDPAAEAIRQLRSVADEATAALRRIAS